MTSPPFPLPPSPPTAWTGNQGQRGGEGHVGNPATGDRRHRLAGLPAGGSFSTPDTTAAGVRLGRRRQETPKKQGLLNNSTSYHE